MTKKIFASLKDKTQVILFDESSNDFNDVIKLFNYDVQDSKIIAFLDNLHSTLDEDELYSINISDEDENTLFSDILLKINSIDNNKAKQEQYREIEVIYSIDDSDKVICLKK